MNNLRELELILDNLEFLASTIQAIDIANQNEDFDLPKYALAIPAENFKTYTEKAKELWAEAWDEVKELQEHRK